MYSSLFTKIGTTLDKVDRVKQYTSVPGTKVENYPFVYFQPEALENSFETNNENMKTYRFLMTVLVGASQTKQKSIFNTVLPQVVDDIIAQFDADWNQGVNADGHRIWVKIDSADAWSLSEEDSGLLAVAPLHVEFKLLTSN